MIKNYQNLNSENCEFGIFPEYGKVLETLVHINLKNLIMFNSKKIAGFFLSLALFGGTAVMAQSTPYTEQQTQQPQQVQIDVSDEEFEKFASAFQHVRAITMGAQQEMADAVQEEGMDIKRFNEIHNAHLNPEVEVTATTEEKQKHEAILKEIETIQVNIQSAMEEKIQEQGLTLQRFEQIAMKMENDPELQQKLREHFQN